MTARRAVPGVRARCRSCDAAIVFATTVAGPNGPGGKWQPLNPLEDPEGRVAVRPTVIGRAVARTLHRDETHDEFAEMLAMPHAATCQPKIAGTSPIPDGVVDLAAHRARRARR